MIEYFIHTLLHIFFFISTLINIYKYYTSFCSWRDCFAVCWPEFIFCLFHFFFHLVFHLFELTHLFPPKRKKQPRMSSHNSQFGSFILAFGKKIYPWVQKQNKNSCVHIHCDSHMWSKHTRIQKKKERKKENNNNKKKKKEKEQKKGVTQKILSCSLFCFCFWSCSNRSSQQLTMPSNGWWKWRSKTAYEINRRKQIANFSSEKSVLYACAQCLGTFTTKHHIFVEREREFGTNWTHSKWKRNVEQHTRIQTHTVGMIFLLLVSNWTIDYELRRENSF